MKKLTNIKLYQHQKRLPERDYQKKRFLEIIGNGKFSDSDCFEWQGSLDKDGYGVTNFSKNGQRRTWRVHRLIYFLLRSDFDPQKLIMHRCDNPKCFNILHLSLGTAKDNSQDRERKGRGKTHNQRGEKNHAASLSEEEVFMIRKLHSTGLKNVEISKILNKHPGTISKIVTRQRWKHI